MGVFFYRRLSAAGRLERQVLSLPFDELDAAHRYLERNGATILSIRKFSALTSYLALFFAYGFSRIRRSELAEVFNNLAMMLGSGVTVLQALQDVREDMKNKRLLGVVNFMISDISTGQTFSEAVERHPGTFSPLIASMCKIGEETGQLDKMLKDISEYLLHTEQIVRDTKRALIYPGFLLAVVTGAVIFWFWYVVPQIVALFQDIGVQLPAVTRLLIFISELMQGYFLGFLLGALLLTMAVFWLKKRVYRVRYAIHWGLLHLPILGKVLHTSLNARICENLGILIGSGVTAQRTLDIIVDSLQNLVYRQRMHQVLEEIRLGNTLASSLRRAQALHPFAIRMIGVGEETGLLGEQTAYVAKQYRQRLDSLVQSLSKSLEPALLATMGIIFALIVAGLLLPIYDLINQIGV